MSILETIQREVADQLMATPFFADIAVFTEHVKDIASEYERALGPVTVTGGKNGVCVIVMTPSADANWGNVEGPFFDEVPIVLLVSENVEANIDPLNGTGKRVLAVCEAAAAALDQFYPLSGNAPLTPMKPTIVRGPETEFLNYNVKFKTMGGIRVPPPTLPAPEFAAVTAGGLTTFTIEAGAAMLQPGSAVFFTTNGSNASPRNPAAQIYLGPVALPAGTVMRARAWLAGWLASDMTQVNA